MCTSYCNISNFYTSCPVSTNMPLACSFAFSIAADNIRCTTNLSTSGVVRENEVIVMTCNIRYSGNWAPVMRWTNSKSRHTFPDDDVTLTTTDTTVTSQLMVTASADLHGCQIVCLTYFTEPSTSLSTNATNIPSYTDMWTSTKLHVILQCKYIFS